MEDFTVECDTCDVEFWLEDGHSDDSGTYCEDCYSKWLDEQVKEFAYLARYAADMRAYGDLVHEPDFAWMDEHDPRL